MFGIGGNDRSTVATDLPSFGTDGRVFSKAIQDITLRQRANFWYMGRDDEIRAHEPYRHNLYPPKG
jgi:uncharacterized protein (DUF934 family)